jgi:hypothetical protein
MKTNYLVLILVAAAFASGVSSFFITTHRVCRPCISSCDTKTFQTQAGRLADMLESQTVSREQIIGQARKVLAIRQNNIIAAAREALKSNSDRQTILNLIPYPTDSNQIQKTSEPGYCCVGPGCCCKFDSAQSKTLAASDPNFLKTTGKLELEIKHSHQSLASMLSDKAIPDERIISAIQGCLEKNNALEIRAVEYFTNIKPHLTAEQQKQIFCWCAAQIRDKAQVNPR